MKHKSNSLKSTKKHLRKSNKSRIHTSHIFLVLLIAYSCNFIAITLTIDCLKQEICYEVNPIQASLQAIHPFLSYIINALIFGMVFLTYYFFTNKLPKYNKIMMFGTLLTLSITFLDMFNDILVTANIGYEITIMIQHLFGY